MSTEQTGFQVSGTPFIQPKHWVVHHPVFTKHPRSMVVYMRLRTAFYEGDDQIRVMTNEQIAELVDLPLSTVRDALRYLAEAGLLVRTNAEKKNAVPVRRFVDELPEGYRGIVNGLRHRDEITAAKGNGKKETDKLGDGSSAPPKVKPSDQDFYQGGDGSSTPGADEPSPGADEPSPNSGKSAGQTGWPNHQETTQQETTHQETLSGFAGDARARGESAQGARPSIEEMTGPGAFVARQRGPRRAPGHPSNCICGQCRPSTPPPPVGDDWLEDLLNSRKGTK